MIIGNVRRPVLRFISVNNRCSKLKHSFSFKESWSLTITLWNKILDAIPSS
jgi:hypothetical protein